MTLYQKIIAVVGMLRNSINHRAAKTDVAETFRENRNYFKGRLVIKDNVLYICTENHPAGPWDPEHFAESTVDGAIREVEVSGVESILADKFSTFDECALSDTATQKEMRMAIQTLIEKLKSIATCIAVIAASFDVSGMGPEVEWEDVSPTSVVSEVVLSFSPSIQSHVVVSNMAASAVKTLAPSTNYTDLAFVAATSAIPLIVTNRIVTHVYWEYSPTNVTVDGVSYSPSASGPQYETGTGWHLAMINEDNPLLSFDLYDGTSPLQATELSLSGASDVSVIATKVSATRNALGLAMVSDVIGSTNGLAHASITNGFVKSSVTNGLATTKFVYNMITNEDVWSEWKCIPGKYNGSDITVRWNGSEADGGWVPYIGSVAQAAEPFSDAMASSLVWRANDTWSYSFTLVAKRQKINASGVSNVKDMSPDSPLFSAAFMNSLIDSGVADSIAPRGYAMFVIDMNPDGSNKWYHIELKASTNNFATAAGLTFFCGTSMNGLGEYDGCRLYAMGKRLDPDIRRWIAIRDTQLMAEGMYAPFSLLVIIDPDMFRRGQGSSWMNDVNEELTWSYVRIGHTSSEKDADGNSRWRATMPVRWYRKLPEWARQTPKTSLLPQ